MTALVGHELEFYLVDEDGSRLPAYSWAQYGAAGLLEYEDFICDVTVACDLAGVTLEQFHPEYGPNQFELSLRPAAPVAAADALVLTRLILGRVARRYGKRISLSPVPFPGSVGCGSHQHLSLEHDSTPLFSGGDGRHGMTTAGESAIAGILAGLPDAQGVLCGSILSGMRTLPGHWSGAYACWGRENREAAVRFISGGAANPYGAHAEVKIGDPSGNPYLGSAVILGLALAGIEEETHLGPEVTVDPVTLSDAERDRDGVVLLPSDQPTVLDALDKSERIRTILGDEAVNAVVAARRYEQEHYGDVDPDELTAKFRLAWSL